VLVAKSPQSPLMVYAILAGCTNVPLILFHEKIMMAKDKTLWNRFCNYPGK
jgi:hypothetical protein